MKNLPAVAYLSFCRINRHDSPMFARTSIAQSAYIRL